MYTPQYEWLKAELPKVNRSETPWLIVLTHSPWYNSYSYHYMEGETMRVMFEPWFVKYKVDVVFAGHVHAYERSVCALASFLYFRLSSYLAVQLCSGFFWCCVITGRYVQQERVSNIAYNIVNGICSPVKDQSAPVYITIGDGGNIEGLANK